MNFILCSPNIHRVRGLSFLSVHLLSRAHFSTFMVGSSGSRISWPLRLVTTAALGLLILVFNHTSRVSPNTTAQVPSPNSWQSLLYTYATPSPALDPYAEHPIRQLMRTGREEWEAKVARQSRTLAAARVEYERRYSMLPPPGFDKWSV